MAGIRKIGSMVFLRVAEESLARALRARLREFDLTTDAAISEPKTYLTTTRDTTPAECRGLRAGGGAVVVLSPTDRQHEREAYHRVGAHYLEMTLDVAPLMRLLRELTAPLEA
jgi:hypothetical protein